MLPQNKNINGFRQALQLSRRYCRGFFPTDISCTLYKSSTSPFKMAAWLRQLSSRFSGLGNVVTALIVGAGLTKIYYETTDSENVSTQKQIQEIIARHDHLKHGNHLRTIDPRQVKTNLDKLDTLAEIADNEDDNVFKYGLPKRSPDYIRYRNHILCYDQARKTPRWVLEHLTRDKVKGEADRAHSTFKPDLNIPARFQSRNDDYWDSGWSRGHMAPASWYPLLLNRPYPNITISILRTDLHITP